MRSVDCVEHKAGYLKVAMDWVVDDWGGEEVRKWNDGDGSR